MVSVDEDLEMLQNSGVFLSSREVEEFLHYIYLLAIAKNLRISGVLEEYHKANTGFNSGFNTDFNEFM